MNNQINLIDYNNRFSNSPILRGQKPLRLGAIILLFVVAVSSVILFILIALSPIPQLRKQEKAASANLDLARPDIVKLSLTKERIKAINSLLKKRSNYNEVFNSLDSIIPRGVAIDSIIAKDNSLSLTVSSKSLNLLDNFMKNLELSQESQAKFSDINIINLSTNDEKNTFQVTASMKIL